MTHKTDTLAQRLRALADELESAERYGLTLPSLVLVDSRVLLSGLDRSSFDAWVDYTEAHVETENTSTEWAVADVNGLGVDLCLSRPTEVAA